MTRHFTPRPGPRNLTALTPVRQPSGHELQRRDQDEQRGLAVDPWDTLELDLRDQDLENDRHARWTSGEAA